VSDAYDTIFSVCEMIDTCAIASVKEVDNLIICAVAAKALPTCSLHYILKDVMYAMVANYPVI